MILIDVMYLKIASGPTIFLQPKISVFKDGIAAMLARIGPTSVVPLLKDKVFRNVSDVKNSPGRKVCSSPTGKSKDLGTKYLIMEKN
jgi:hypothetical protein